MFHPGLWVIVRPRCNPLRYMGRGSFWSDTGISNHYFQLSFLVTGCLAELNTQRDAVSMVFAERKYDISHIWLWAFIWFVVAWLKVSIIDCRLVYFYLIDSVCVFPNNFMMRDVIHAPYNMVPVFSPIFIPYVPLFTSKSCFIVSFLFSFYFFVNFHGKQLRPCRTFPGQA